MLRVTSSQRRSLFHENIDNGHLGGMGILVEWASWWNWHLGGMGILVELASCQFQ
ncbi:MAG: hypothetical protein F6K50_40370 [Moorea sp. SIO3I7]|nr:hypothetical protein [Moorena sp. SIO3I7]